MTGKEVEALFTLAGIDVLAKWELPNGYTGPEMLRGYYLRDWEEGRQSRPSAMELFASEAAYQLKHPWWLVKTKWGLVKIGWRKRVINIDWSDTPVRCTTGNVTTEDVTKWEEGVHAWSTEKAVEYLKKFKVFAEQQRMEMATV